MLRVPLCGERVLMRLESIGVHALADLRGRDPWELVHEINLAAGRVIWRPPMAILALSNLVAASELAGSGRAATPKRAGKPAGGCVVPRPNADPRPP
jgi:hypothetical protein